MNDTITIIALRATLCEKDGRIEELCQMHARRITEDGKKIDSQAATIRTLQKRLVGNENIIARLGRRVGHLDMILSSPRSSKPFPRCEASEFWEDSCGCKMHVSTGDIVERCAMHEQIHEDFIEREKL